MLRPTSLLLLVFCTLGCHSGTSHPAPTGPEPVRPRIHQIQGAGHRSPLVGLEVRGVTGIVTGVDFRGRNPGYWIQDPDGDGDITTSEGLFVATGQLDDPSIEPQPGQTIEVDGKIEEYTDPERGKDLPLTRLVAHRARIVSAESRPLPAAVQLGRGARPIPQTIDDDGLRQFDPQSDAIDFFESLEGMRVAVSDAVVVGATSRFGEIAVLPDAGAGIEHRSARGGLLLREEGSHGARLLVSPRWLGSMPALAVGSRFELPLTGVLGYDFSNFRLLPTALPQAIPPEARAEVTTLRGGGVQLTVATFNVFNLSARDPAKKLRRLAETLVRDLGAPDIVALQEVQDQNGSHDDGTVDGDATLQALTAAVRDAGGPGYDFRQINPIDGSDGGQPGGNIRVAFLFQPARLSFVDRGRAGAEDETKVVADTDSGHPRLTLSPGRVAPRHPAFVESRKALAGEFRFRDQPLFVIVAHLASKRDDEPSMGARQPPARLTEDKRTAQAQAIHRLMENFLELDEGARVIVLGDMNELEFRPPIQALKGSGWTNLIESLPVTDRYTFNYNGDSQTLDHVLVSPALADRAPEIDIVHVNADQAHADRASDHDPVVIQLTWK